MDRNAKQYDKASMKKAILKQEETFRKQVHELHRLYQIQKLLKRDLNNTPSKLDKRKLRQTSDRYIGNDHVEIGTEEEEEDDIEVELTLTIGSNRKKRDASSPASHSGCSVCSSSTDSGGVKLISNDQWGLFLGSNAQLNVTSDRNSATAFDVEEPKNTRRLNQPSLELTLSESKDDLKSFLHVAN